MSKLLIVESPTKVKTIKKYLGKDFEVAASMGHVRDLVKNKISVDIKDDFKPTYKVLPGKEELVEKLKKLVKQCEEVYLATDPDREGEAISWHLANILKLDKKSKNRVAFNEMTQNGILAGMKNPKTLDMDLVDAQQARRILDRIVGYKLSPFLIKKIRKGVSAGRVQSVSVKIIADREEEIKKFVAEEYWLIDGIFSGEGIKKKLEASFYGDKNGKIVLENEEQTKKILKDLEDSKFYVDEVKKSTRKRKPYPPFNTSSLQQEASKRLGFIPKRTMKVAQELYEGIDVKGFGSVGLITYMRTDSLRLSDDAVKEARSFIKTVYGTEFLPAKKNIYKSKNSSQDGHEAIRPTTMELKPQEIKTSLTADQYKLYKLIWDRFLACQMTDMILNTTKITITEGTYLFTCSGYTINFKGFSVLYQTEGEEKEKKLPVVEQGCRLVADELAPSQHFTEPPPRYTEASLIKTLEENGIGRPSTYAPTISTILAREYVVKDGKSLAPTELGIVTNELLKENFKDIVDVNFTAQMEEGLDGVEKGEENWKELLRRFYSPFEESLEQAKEKLKDVKINLQSDKTDIACEKCGKPMEVKFGRFGKFLGCSGYPDCSNKLPYAAINEKEPVKKEEVSDVVCEACGSPMVIKYGRFGKFLGCSSYPECKNIVGIDDKTQGFCPKCGAEIVKRRSKKGRVFYGCKAYPGCDFVTWSEPVDDKCPKCKSNLFVKKTKKKTTMECLKENCGYKKELSEE